jgi:radical SAM superfamily enzyme YgiQ (UPF0313 family)
MNNYLDSAIIVDCTYNDLLENERSQIIRPLAPMALHHACIQKEYPATVLDYFWDWHNDDLISYITTWCDKNNVYRPILLASSLFNIHVLQKNNKFYDFIKRFKELFPQSLFFTGGPLAVLDKECDIFPDAIFRGRSLHLFERWLEHPDDPYPDTLTTETGVAVYNRADHIIREEPVVPVLYDDYCLNSSDIISFETRLGCKFNCAFCNYEFRNAKNIRDVQSEELYNFFNNANKKYGIKYFSVVDDTFNEDDIKLLNVKQATDQLDFQPVMAGFTRFDILQAKPEQAELMDKIGFWGHFFGIETLHREASKIIRKGIRKQEAFKFLEEYKKQYPHHWICSGYIIGLPPEPLEHVFEVWDYLIQNNLIDGGIINDLILYKHQHYHGSHDLDSSDMSKYPEKFGFTITNKIDGVYQWKTEFMDNKIAEKYTAKLSNRLLVKGVPIFDGWEALGRTVIGITNLFDPKQKQEYKDALKKSDGKLYINDGLVEKRLQQVNKYILRKKSYVNSL